MYPRVTCWRYIVFCTEFDPILLATLLNAVQSNSLIDRCI